MANGQCLMLNTSGGYFQLPTSTGSTEKGFVFNKSLNKTTTPVRLYSSVTPGNHQEAASIFQRKTQPSNDAQCQRTHSLSITEAGNNIAQPFSKEDSYEIRDISITEAGNNIAKPASKEDPGEIRNLILARSKQSPTGIIETLDGQTTERRKTKDEIIRNITPAIMQKSDRLKNEETKSPTNTSTYNPPQSNILLPLASNKKKHQTKPITVVDALQNRTETGQLQKNGPNKHHSVCPQKTEKSNAPTYSAQWKADNTNQWMLDPYLNSHHSSCELDDAVSDLTVSS
ncbi:hypothetical protein [Endozoicomonas sp.]|uniref:hypothetical protein n=1 Tax=Endozoicomonas sp. TaxID=1892382 RepID=UPI00383B352A